MASASVTLQVTPYAQTGVVYIAYNFTGATLNQNYALGVVVERNDLLGRTGSSTTEYQKYYFVIRYTGDGSLSFPIYPLPAHSNFIIRVFFGNNFNSFNA